MPTPVATLKLKKFRRHFGIAAPRVMVRSHIAWQWYAVGLGVLIALVGGVAWTVAQRGEVSLLIRQIGKLNERLADSDAELVRLRTEATMEQNAVQIERSAQQQLLSRVRELEQENASLKEDLLLVERLLKGCPKKLDPMRHG